MTTAEAEAIAMPLILNNPIGSPEWDRAIRLLHRVVSDATKTTRAPAPVLETAIK